ncbi:PfkB family carbohydrate kinase [Streptacidiphilus monticola]
MRRGHRADPGEADRPYAGGSPANVAYGLARLGRPIALLTQLGDDPMGRLVRRHLEGAGTGADGRSAGGDADGDRLLDGRGHASYEFAVAWSLDPDGPTAPVLPSARHVHLGSIASVMEPGASAARRLLRALRESGATVSYDPNVRPALFGERKAGIAAVEECVALSHLVKASDEDLEWLYPGVPAAEAAARWLALGPRAVIVTRGGDGAFAVTAEGSLHADAVPTTVVDTVGAGTRSCPRPWTPWRGANSTARRWSRPCGGPWPRRRSRCPAPAPTPDGSRARSRARGRARLDRLPVLRACPADPPGPAPPDTASPSLRRGGDPTLRWRNAGVRPVRGRSAALDLAAPGAPPARRVGNDAG